MSLNMFLQEQKGAKSVKDHMVWQTPRNCKISRAGGTAIARAPGVGIGVARVSSAKACAPPPSTEDDDDISVYSDPPARSVRDHLTWDTPKAALRARARGTQRKRIASAKVFGSTETGAGDQDRMPAMENVDQAQGEANNLTRADPVEKQKARLASYEKAKPKELIDANVNKALCSTQKASDESADRPCPAPPTKQSKYPLQTSSVSTNASSIFVILFNS